MRCLGTTATAACDSVSAAYCRKKSMALASVSGDSKAACTETWPSFSPPSLSSLPAVPHTTPDEFCLCKMRARVFALDGRRQNSHLANLQWLWHPQDSWKILCPAVTRQVRRGVPPTWQEENGWKRAVKSFALDLLLHKLQYPPAEFVRACCVRDAVSLALHARILTSAVLNSCFGMSYDSGQLCIKSLQACVPCTWTRRLKGCNSQGMCMCMTVTCHGHMPGSNTCPHFHCCMHACSKMWCKDAPGQPLRSRTPWKS